jgi:RsiW-degrading membrane proteinase PrsW (M82 family)
MKIPSLPKGASGFPLVVIVAGVGLWYFFLKDKNKKG